MFIEIYGVPWCGICKLAVSACREKPVSYVYYDCEDENTLHRLEEMLGTEIRSVPHVFIDGTHISNGFVGLKEKLARV